MTVKYDTETEKWLKKNIIQQTTVMKCEKCGLYYKPSLGHKCENKEKYVPDNKVGNKKTNRDKLNEMSNEEFASFINARNNYCSNYCIHKKDDCDYCNYFNSKCFIKWLESEVE